MTVTGPWIFRLDRWPPCALSRIGPAFGGEFRGPSFSDSHMSPMGRFRRHTNHPAS